MPKLYVSVSRSLALMSRRCLGQLAAVCVILCSLACVAGDDAPAVDLVLTGGTVVDVAAGGTMADREVWISDGEIVAVVSSGEKSIPRGVQTIDLSGRFLVPGLTDAHVHLDHVDELELYTSQGVTTVFNLRGVPRHLGWRDQIARGERKGPTIYTAGDYMDGYPASMQPMMSFDNPEDAATSVGRQKSEGYDLIKVYSSLTLEQLEAIHVAAREVGMPVVGHGSENYTLQQLLDAGQNNLAHGQELIRWFIDGPDDEEGLQEVVETMAGGRLTVTPNLAWTDGLIRQGEDLEGLLAEPIAQSLPPAILQPFRRVNNRYIRRGVDWVPDVKARFEREKKLTRDLQAAGVILLTGTDASTSGVLPGSSLLREIELLNGAGLSPLDALRAATLNPGRFIAEHASSGDLFGQIAEGYRADIVVVEKNPLEDVSRLRDRVGVVVRGRWLDRASVEARLAELAERSRELTPRVVELENAIYSRDLEAARRIFDQVRAETPGEVPFSQYVPFYVGYGFLYGEDGYNPDPERRRAALALYQMYAEAYPEYHSSHYLLALALEANGENDEAIASLEKSLEIHPYAPDVREKLAELQAGLSSAEEP